MVAQGSARTRCTLRAISDTEVNAAFLEVGGRGAEDNCTILVLFSVSATCNNPINSLYRAERSCYCLQNARSRTGRSAFRLPFRMFPECFPAAHAGEMRCARVHCRSMPIYAVLAGPSPTRGEARTMNAKKYATLL